ncbi:hypothetical protein I0C86_16330 [Plantactinospora sp. S1510]|uniref:Uncharacterized protein n=1 Tax=Plantactinospora alkalitolerans TaxID=2789879 RepID=A0ABS0GWR4_9ACTN|nr:hypothetical protein [Plantactinospora alkalitolerans]MBF9130516.1 hypothetical protein [Plantactinospora alkalitolerans]
MMNWIGSLGDRVLTRFVPQAKAGALPCWTEQCYSGSSRICRSCCATWQGVVCQACQYCG